MPNLKRNITIIGGGLVGSLLAVLFRQRNYQVDIFEKRKDIRKQKAEGDRSINLVITSRGLKGLDSAGLLSQALELSVPIRGRMIHAKDGAQTYQPYGNEKECNFSISRLRLNQFLLTAAEKSGATLHFEHSVDAINFKSREATFSTALKTSVKPYDLLLGTDGAGSRVRKLLCSEMPNRFSERTEWLEADYKELFLPAGPNHSYLLEKNALHIWPRGSHMMMALANQDGSFTMTVYMPRERIAAAGHNFNDIKTEQNVETLFSEEFSDVVAMMPSYREEFMNHPQGKLGTVRTTQWVYEDSVAILGDAAHAIVPFFGQGMNSGFEDCTELIRIVDEHKAETDSEMNWTQILELFQNTQKPNADAIADMAIENWFEMRDRVGDPQFLLRKKVEALLEKNFPEYFKSRYGMVTYTLNPYSKAREVGRLHDKILAELCSGIQSADEVSLPQAKRLLESDLANFNRIHKMQLGTDPLVEVAGRQTKTL